MRKIVLTLTLAVLSVGLYAQQGFHVGVQGTPYLSLILDQQTYGEPEYEYDPTYGFAGGLEVGYHFIDRLGLFTGIQYAQQGQNYDDVHPSTEVPVTREVSLDYLRVPLYLRFRSQAEVVGFYLNAGMYFDFLQSASIQYHVGSEDRSIPDATDRFTQDDIGLLTGLGAAINLTDRLYVTAGARFTYGFGDINDPDWRIPNNDGEYDGSQNASIGFNVGVAYNFGPF